MLQFKDGGSVSAKEIKLALDQNAADAEHQDEFSMSYEFGGRTWQVMLWAKDFEEAEEKLRALKNTGVLFGRIIKKVPLDPTD